MNENNITMVSNSIPRNVSIYMICALSLCILIFSPISVASSVAKLLDTNEFSADNIIELQQALTSDGYDPGPIDGILGSKTKDALRIWHQNMKKEGAVSSRVDKNVSKLLSTKSVSKLHGSTMVRIRDRSGQLLDSVKCKKGEAVFIKGSMVPCGGAILSDRGEMGGDVYSSDKLARCVVKRYKMLNTKCANGEYECFRQAHKDAIETCAKQ